MPERVEYEPKFLHTDRKLVTPMDVFRAAEFFTSSILSGGSVSGGGLTLKVVSSVVTMRPVNLHMMNSEGGWLEVQFRDGNAVGPLVMGPFRLQAYSERVIPFEELQGHKFTSAIYCEVRSGWTGQPLSNGLQVNMGVVQEPGDFYE